MACTGGVAVVSKEVVHGDFYTGEACGFDVFAIAKKISWPLASIGRQGPA